MADKFDQLKLMVKYKANILVLTETKIDPSFQNQQFHIEGFCLPYRLERNKHGGGVLVYIRGDIPSKILKKTFLLDDIEGIFIELNLRKYKWLLCATYHLPNKKDNYFFNHLGKAIDIYHQTYDKYLLIDDFSAEDTEPCLSQFLFEYDGKNIVSEKTCLKFSVHDRNIQQLALDVYRVTKGLAPTAISSLFLQCSNNKTLEDFGSIEQSLLKIFLCPKKLS